MRTGPEGIALIKKWEGLRTDAYLDPVGIPTIGYGHTEGVYMGQSITPEDAERLLLADLRKFESYVNSYVTAPLNQSQFDALVSFTYNLGPGRLRDSTLLKKVNANPSDPTIPAEFDRWVYAGGTRLAGLVSRRREEAELYAGDAWYKKKSTWALYAGMAFAALALVLAIRN